MPSPSTGTRDLPSRCSPSHEARTDSRRGRRRRRRKASHRPRARRPHSRSRCCACCAGAPRRRWVRSTRSRTCRGVATPIVSARTTRRRRKCSPAPDRAGIDATFEGTAERNADRQRHRQLGTLDDACRRRRRLLDGLVRVPPAEAVGSRKREVHAIETGGGQPVVTLLVQRQPRVLGPVAPLDRGDDLFGACHLRHRVGADEARGLDAREPCGGEPVDELCANRRGERLRLVLETVARSHVADRHAHGDARRSAARAASESPPPRLRGPAPARLPRP